MNTSDYISIYIWRYIVENLRTGWGKSSLRPPPSCFRNFFECFKPSSKYPSHSKQLSVRSSHKQASTTREWHTYMTYNRVMHRICHSDGKNIQKWTQLPTRIINIVLNKWLFEFSTPYFTSLPCALDCQMRYAYRSENKTDHNQKHYGVVGC